MRTFHLRFTALLGALLLSSLSVASAQLAAVGPTNPDNGYPRFYTDVNGLRLDLCLTDPVLCGLAAPVTLSAPGQPFPLNYAGTFPDESFYSRCVAKMP